MKLDARGYISIVELILYVPCLLVGVIVCARHGFSRSSGWIFLVILCLIRIIGSVCNIVSYGSPSENLYETIAILDSVGISPLLLATLGILTRL